MKPSAHGYSAATLAGDNLVRSHNVLMIAHYFPPGTSSGTLRTVKFAKYLPEWNWQPVVLTMRPDAHHPMRYDDTLLKELSPNLRVYRTAVWRPDRTLASAKKRITGVFTRSLVGNDSSAEAVAWTSLRKSRTVGDYVRDWLQFPDAYGGWFISAAWHGRQIIESQKVDLIYSTAPSPVAHLIAMQLKRWSGRPWVADFRDPWECLFPESVYVEGQQAWREKAEVAAAEKVIRSADLVIANTERLCEAFRNRFPDVPQERWTTIPNGFDEEDFVSTNMKPERTERLTISHTGTFFGNLRSPGEVVTAVQDLVNQGHIDPEKICLQFVGCGAYPDPVPPFLQIVPRVSHRDSLRIMDQSHALLLLQQSDKYWLQVPAKTYEYMAARRWILGIAPEGATRDILERLPNSIAVHPNRPEDLKTAILKLYRMFLNETLYPAPAATGYVARFSRREQTRVLAGHFERVLEEQAARR